MNTAIYPPSGASAGIGFAIPVDIHPNSSPLSLFLSKQTGNSGGPLLDSAGRLVGMNTAIYSPSGASAGIGFAIPADTLKFIVETIIREGKVVRPLIGITYLESSQAKALGKEGRDGGRGGGRVSVSIHLSAFLNQFLK